MEKQKKSHIVITFTLGKWAFTAAGTLLVLEAGFATLGVLAFFGGVK